MWWRVVFCVQFGWDGLVWDGGNNRRSWEGYRRSSKRTEKITTNNGTYIEEEEENQISLTDGDDEGVEIKDYKTNLKINIINTNILINIFF